MPCACVGISSCSSAVTIKVGFQQSHAIPEHRACAVLWKYLRLPRCGSSTVEPKPILALCLILSTSGNNK